MTVIIIGAGAAGLTAAYAASKSADKVILIEKNNMAGKKLRITGKGRCNITNIADTEDMLKMYPKNAKFLYSALYTFSNYDIIRLLEEYGVKTKTERGGRVFPESDKASDVAEALRRAALQNNVTLLKAEVRSLIIENGAVKGVKTDKENIYSDSVIVCTGGKSYPMTGSTGDGYRFARQAGHTIVEPRASLIPIITREKWVKDVMGLSLRNIGISAYDSRGKKVYSDFGEMLFTHFGISGPTVLSMSAHIRDMGEKEYKIEIDLKPALTSEQLDARIVRDFNKYRNKQLQNALGDLLPKALIPVVIRISGIDAEKAVNSVTKAERADLADAVKRLTLTAVGVRPVEEAIVTAGGVSVREINPSTMESKLVKGLYFAGEVIDVDGCTGGYNLQASFSMGYLAGSNASKTEG